MTGRDGDPGAGKTIILILIHAKRVSRGPRGAGGSFFYSPKEDPESNKVPDRRQPWALGINSQHRGTGGERDGRACF